MIPWYGWTWREIEGGIARENLRCHSSEEAKMFWKMDLRRAVWGKVSRAAHWVAM